MSGLGLLGKLQASGSLKLQFPHDLIGEDRLLLNSLTWLLATYSIAEMFTQGPQFLTTACECGIEMLTV